MCKKAVDTNTNGNNSGILTMKFVIVQLNP
jgi:hypothetical protein